MKASQEGSLSGRTLGHYDSLVKLGEGGMGEVYRAQDTQLKRDVAIKVLSERVLGDPLVVPRLQREAQLLASLNHPNVATVYSFEQADDIDFFVLELVEGESLAEKVAQGPLPPGEALEIGRQIAEGIAAAHAKGIIHRDLKPGNVLITSEGQAKILDFGLGKFLRPEIPAGNASDAEEVTVEMTTAGVIMGTTGYMSPEQAQGRPVDERTDIWAFGCVFFEILSGRKAFEGETATETIAAILKSEPTWEALPAATPSLIRFFLRQSLQKEPRDRLRDIADFRMGLQQALSEGESAVSSEMSGAATHPLWKRVIPLGVGVAACVITAIFIWTSTRPENMEPSPMMRFPLRLPESPSGYFDFALSPDGTHLVYPANYPENGQLYLYSLSEMEAKPIPGTEGGGWPFFSPDSQWVGFYSSSDKKLKTVSLRDGMHRTIWESDAGFRFHDPSWGPEGNITFCNGSESGIFLVPSLGGTPRLLTNPDSELGELWHHAGQILPGGKSILYTVERGRTRPSQIIVQSLETGKKKEVLEVEGWAEYVRTGHLVYASSYEKPLMAVRFDPTRLEVTEKPAVVAENVMMFSFSDQGSLTYLPHREGTTEELSLLWVDREGNEEPLEGPKEYINYLSNFRYSRLSPDGSQFAMRAELVKDENTDIWIYDLRRGTTSRLTSHPALDSRPLWTPDGQKVAFSSYRDGTFNIYWKSADGTGEVERLTTSPNFQDTDWFSSDLKTLVFFERDPETSGDIWTLSLDGERIAQPLLRTPNNEGGVAISPNGRWMAYHSDETGRMEVYVRPFPNVEAGKWPISTNGGSAPLWSPDGQELFYNLRDRAMMVVQIEIENGFAAGIPEVLFEGDYRLRNARDYDIPPDGRRFLMTKVTKAADPRPEELIVVLNRLENL